MRRTERVAAAIDGVVETYGLTRGEALFVLVACVRGTLEDPKDTEAREVLKQAVIQCIEDASMKPLLVCLPDDIISRLMPVN